MKALLALGCSLLLATLALGAPGDLAVSQVNPNRVAGGAEVTITGVGFEAKPSVFLQQGGSPKKFPLRVTAFSSTQITATVKDAPAGVYDLFVRIGTDTAALSSGLEMAAPEPQQLSAASGAPGAEITISGAFFGTKKGRVNLLAPLDSAAAKSAKVQSWSNDSIRFLVPKLAQGNYLIVVQSRVGGSSAVPFQVTAPSTGGQLHLTATVDGNAFAADLGSLALQNQPPHLYVVHGQRASQSREINVRFTYDPANGTFPAEVAGTADALVEYVEFGSGVNIWRADGMQGSFAITLSSASGGRLRGTFHATLPLALGTGVATRVLESGSFEVIIP
ncbi:MAG: IPT/TIG domain-containing protein [Planctomycetes bacterium]|nr:IPT/TIG domain-containing protein [Planctomycetota bacterium]